MLFSGCLAMVERKSAATVKGMDACEIWTLSHLKSCHDSFIEAWGKKENFFGDILPFQFFIYG